MSLRDSHRSWNTGRRLSLAIIVASIAAQPAGASCPADFDESGDVGFGDLTGLLINWAPAPMGMEPWDLDNDGTVGFSDLTQLLILWGECSCKPSDLSWVPTFDGLPGTNFEVYDLMTWDDGSGPALYAGGEFTNAGGTDADRVARWNGSSWSALGSGIDNVVYSLAAFDGALYAGGFFDSAGGVPMSGIARWDGSSWSSVGGGVDVTVRALAVFDDGSGSAPSLYAGGNFTIAGGAPASNIARWDGSSWSPVSTGVNGLVHALEVYDDGAGAALYAGGAFTNAGGIPANRIARWDGTSWSALGNGMPASGDAVISLAVHDDGSGAGPALYAGGEFTFAGTVRANRIARWDGTSWSALSTGMEYPVRALAVWDDGSGSGPALYAGGSFTIAGSVNANGVARWDGASWSALGAGIDDSSSALAVYDDGSGPALYCGGSFSRAGDVPVLNIARWDGSTWSALDHGINDRVLALAVHDDGGGAGPALYVGGFFTSAGGVNVSRIARWDGSSWSALGSGIPSSSVSVLAVHDDGTTTGPALYAGGSFSNVGGALGDHIARWDGASWSAVGAGTNNSISAFVVFDEGSVTGPSLFAGGNFTTAGGLSANRIARWNGATWSALGSGMSGGLNIAVHALAVHDDGSGGGPALYAGGRFTTAGGVTVNHIARWNGSSWAAIAGGMSGSGNLTTVTAFAVHDDGSGSGPALFAGGRFTTAGGVAVNHVARWNGASWTDVGGGTNDSVTALTVHDDGTGLGPSLVAAGFFDVAGGVALADIARWDGNAWTALGNGTNQAVLDFAVYDDGSGPALYAGGDFTSALDSGDSYLAKWGCAR